MTYAHISGGGVVHFPPFGSLKDSVSTIEPPAPVLLPAIAALIRPAELMSFSRRLLNAASKRRRNPRWEKVNRSRIVLAQLCLDRALGVMPSPAEDDASDADPEAKRDLVVEAYETFGANVARELAARIGVAFDECGEAIERLERRPS